MKPIRKIHWKSTGWISFSNTVMSFYCRGLPKGVHLSLSYNPADEYINLHVTKNADSPIDKPKVEIARVRKTEAEAIFGLLFQAFFASTFTPFDMRPYQVGRSKATWGAKYISIMRLKQKRGYRNISRHFANTFAAHSRKKGGGTKLELLARIDQAFAKLAVTPEMRDFMIDHFKRIPRNFPAGADFGLLASENFRAFLLRFDNRWFTLEENVNPLSVLQRCIQSAVYQALIDQTKTAIEIVTMASTHRETEPYDNNSILLTLVPNPTT
jgi:hypothetical protein